MIEGEPVEMTVKTRRKPRHFEWQWLGGFLSGL